MAVKGLFGLFVAGSMAVKKLFGRFYGRFYGLFVAGFVG